VEVKKFTVSTTQRKQTKQNMTDKRPREELEEGKGTAGVPPAKRPESEWISEEAMAAAGIKAFALAQIEHLGGGSPAAVALADRYMLYKLAKLVVPSSILAFGWRNIPREDRGEVNGWKLVDGSWQPGKSGPDLMAATYATIGSRVYVIESSAMAVYDHIRDEWKKLAPPPEVGVRAVSAIATGGMLHLIGAGMGAWRHARYDPATNVWAAPTTVGSDGVPRLVTIGHDVYVVSCKRPEGGSSTLLVVAKFDPETDTLGPLAWGPAYSLEYEAVTANDQIYVVAASRNIWMVDPRTLGWTDTGVPVPAPEDSLSTIAAVGQRVYVPIYGRSETWHLGIYDTATKRWDWGPDLPQDIGGSVGIVACGMPPFKEPVRPAVEWK